MKIQCNVCETAEATVLCCADEAALCFTCDEKVHAANKLAGKHHRVLLSNSNSQMPKCDICQETVGYFFCLEDRAVLCRKCDVAIHTVNNTVSSHQRFLLVLTGVKVGAEAAALVTSSSPKKSHFNKNNIPWLSTDTKKLVPSEAAGSDDFAPPSLPFIGGSSANDIVPQQFDEFLGLTDVNQSYNYIDNVSTKADSGKLGGSDFSPVLRAIELELDEELNHVPDVSWSVPQICSPTASGLYWPNSHNHKHQLDATAFVPDICYQQSTSSPKRRRQF